MRIFLPVTFLIFILFCSCNSQQDDNSAIDYSSLDELSSEIVMEIGESEDYLPGHIRDVEVTPEGMILVADTDHNTIEQFNSEGEHVGTVAQEGRGPGEVAKAYNLHLLNEDTLIARHRSGKKDYFAPTDGEVFKHVNTAVNEEQTQRLSVLEAVSNNKLYAIKENHQPVNEQLDDPQTTIKEAFVVIHKNEKVIEDSIHVLKRGGNFAFEMEGGGFIQSDFPFQINELAVPLDNGNYLITRSDSSTFYIYDEDHSLVDEVPAKIKERPITDEDLDYLSEERPDEIMNVIDEHRPDHKPPYTDIYASKNYLWLQTNETKDGKEIVVLDFDGEPIGKFSITEHESIAHVEDEKAYIINRNPEQGNRVLVHEFDF